MLHTAIALAVLATASPPPAERDTVYLAGGCFWGVEAVFEHVHGVVDVVSGYTGGTFKQPSYELVSAGITGHAESVRVIYDPAEVSLEQLLGVFFTVAHDPTQLNRQGPDYGTQYRSAIFYTSQAQLRAAKDAIAGLTKSRTYAGPVVTQLVSLDRWYDAEPYHQDFAAKNPRHPYIVQHDAPKVQRLKAEFPALFRER
jgi:peptide-methionine (S)-S-oxide reductase